MRLARILLGLAVLLVVGKEAQGQAQWALYGQGTGGTLQFPGGAPRMWGGTVGIYRTKRVGPLAIGPDFRGTIIKSGNENGPFTDASLDEGQFGVRVAAVPQRFHLMPYAEGLIGAGYWRAGVGIKRQDAMHFLMQAVVGVDYKLTRRIDWRVGEFTYARTGASPGFIHPITYSTGIVIELK